MNSILSLFKNKSLWFSAISIVVLFLIVPYSIFNYSYLLFSGMITLMAISLFSDKKGFVVVIMAYSLMIPFGDFKIGTGATYYITYSCVFICWILSILLKKKVKYNFTHLIKIGLLLLFISFFFAIKNNTFLEINIIVYYLLSTFVLFYISFCDPITLEEFFFLLDLIFYFIVYYVIKEMIFHQSPYQFLYDNLLFDHQLRAKGLTGNALLLSCFLSFYHTALLIKGMIFKKWNILNFILLFPLVFLCASKTGFILIVFGWLLFFVLSKAYKNGKVYIGFLILIGLSFQLFPVFDTFTEVPLERMLNSNTDQRVGSYSIATQIIGQNQLGVGLSKVGMENEINRAIYKLNSLYDSDFLILDNSYLTALVSYGVLGFLLFVIYINPVRFAIKKGNSERFKKQKNVILLLFIIWLLQNFSFDTFYHFSSNCFYFLLSGLIIKHFSFNKVEN